MDTTINVTVTDSNPVAKVTADNFEVVRGSGNLTAADVITKSNAQAKNSSGTVIPGATIDVDDTDLATLNDKIKMVRREIIRLKYHRMERPAMLQ